MLGWVVVPSSGENSVSRRGEPLDLCSRLPGDFGDRFTPAARKAIQNADKPTGVPQNTDTSVILYNKGALKSAGIASIPTELRTAWI
jgi:ABC-type glycerol-3-phosphate transport system substrate-binding protein